MIQIQSNTKQLEGQLYLLSKALGMELGPIIKEEGKFILQSAIRVTPPPSRPAGVRAINRSLNLVADPLDYQAYEQRATDGGFYKSIAKYIRRRQTDKLQSLFNKPQLQFWTGFTVLQNEEALRAKHQSMRRFGPSGGGRVYGQKNSLAYGPDMRRYAKKVHDRVGFMLNGWSQAASVLGLKIKQFAQKTYEGSTQKVEYNFGRNPFITVVNSNIRMEQPQRKIDSILAYRIRITEKKIDRANQKLAINLGFTKLAKGSY
jgi:hypothetical protein